MRKVFFLFSAAVMAVCCGCTNMARFDYSGSQGGFISAAPRGAGNKVLAVLPYNDVRALENSMPESGSFYWGMLPIVPFGPVFKAEPEKSEDFLSLGFYHFNPSADLQNAAAISFRESNLFGNVVAVNNMEQAREVNADYIWVGQLRNSEYQGYMFTYCITYFLAPVLWTVGFPEGVSVNKLAVAGTLYDSAGNVVFANDLYASDWLMHWIYARVGEDCRNYPVLMKQLMNRTVADMAAISL